MTAITRLLATTLALFVDDGRLAVETVALLAVTALVAHLQPAPSWPALVILLAGTLALLSRNVLRASRASGAGRDRCN